MVEEVPVPDVSRYVARFASDWESENPRWWEIDGTLVFVDISGFTNLSERLTVFGRIGVEELTTCSAQLTAVGASVSESF